jgi:SNF2 family DNA or RNA helicase
MTKTKSSISTKPTKCGLSSLHGTPVLVVPALEMHNLELKRVLGAVFLMEQGVWLFPAFVPYIDDVVRDLQIVLDEIEFSPEAQAHIAECENVSVTLGQETIPTEYREGFKFVTKPYAHQTEALNYALLMLRCGIFYDMGLGKTKIVVDLIRHERQKALILTPVVGITTWFNEAELHSGGELKVGRLVGTPKKKRAIIAESPGFDILVAGYDTAKRYYDDIINTFEYTIIVADESHNLRTSKSARTKGAVALSARATRRIIMSGTPSLGNPLHLWGQLQFMGKFIPAKDFWTFRRFYAVTLKAQPKIIVGYKNLEMLNEKVGRVSIRKMKDECLDLPPRQVIDVPFEVSAEQKKRYNELVDGACTMLQDGTMYEAAHSAAVIQKLLQILSGFFIIPLPDICDGCEQLKVCVADDIKPYTGRCLVKQRAPEKQLELLKSNPKLEALEGLLDSILAEESNKVIVWGYFRAELDIIGGLLKKKGIRYVRVDGSNSNKAQDIAKEFNETPEIRVYLANISTGVALTLTSAAYMIYYGLTYKLDEYLQSMDRNYRIGQTKKVITYRLIAQKSVLEYVAKALRNKMDIAATLIDRVDCIVCDRNVICLDAGVIPFSSECVYSDRVSRVITHPQKL